MPTFDQLDAVADLVNPVLLIVTLAFPALPRIRARFAISRWYLITAFALIVTYGLMALDQAFHLWSSFGSDYSTHTAFASTLVITWKLAGKRILAVGLTILGAYIGLMLYQHYHSLLDISTTFAIASTPIAIAVWKSQHKAVREARS